MNAHIFSSGARCTQFLLDKDHDEQREQWRRPFPERNQRACRACPHRQQQRLRKSACCCNLFVLIIDRFLLSLALIYCSLFCMFLVRRLCFACELFACCFYSDSRSPRSQLTGGGMYVQFSTVSIQGGSTVNGNLAGNKGSTCRNRCVCVSVLSFALRRPRLLLR